MHKTNFEKLASDDPRISDSNINFTSKEKLSVTTDAGGAAFSDPVQEAPSAAHCYIRLIYRPSDLTLTQQSTQPVTVGSSSSLSRLQARQDGAGEE